MCLTETCFQDINIIQYIYFYYKICPTVCLLYIYSINNKNNYIKNIFKKIYFYY